MKRLYVTALFLLASILLFSCAGSGFDASDDTSVTDTAEPEVTATEEEYYNSLKGKWINVDMKVSIPEGKKPIAITVDDGPNGCMDQILDVLEELDATATFFIIGSGINSDTEGTLKRAVALGCELGNHSWSHPDLSALLEDSGKEAVIKEIKDTHDALKAVTGIENFLIRPPYGSSSDALLHVTNAPHICWSLDAADWDGATVEEAYNNAIGGIAEGTILLTHCNSTTVESLKLIIPKLREMGYEPVTVSELAAYEGWTMRSTSRYNCFPSLNQ